MFPLKPGRKIERQVTLNILNFSLSESTIHKISSECGDSALITYGNPFQAGSRVINLAAG